MSDRNATPIAAACSSGGSNSSTSLSVEDNVAISGTAGPPVVVDRSLVRFLETPDIPLLGSKKLTPRQRWGIDVSEPLIATAKCYVFKLNMPQWAKLYIFGRRVCFRTLLSVGPLKVSDSRTWDEIDGVEGEDGVLLNSMRIVYKDGTKAYLAFELPEERVRLLAVCEQQLRRQRAAAVNGVSVPQTPQEDITSDVDDEEENDPAKIADTASVGASFHLAAASASTDRTGLRILKGGRPKHMTILTIGSRGDVQPFISLGKTLQKRGYNVRIASFAEYQPWVESHGIEFRVVAGDAVTVMSLCVDNGMFTFSFIKGGIAQLDWIKKLFETAYEATEGTDLILLTQSAMIGANLGAARGVPVMHVFTMPWSATKDFPHPFLVPEKDKGAAYNLSSWKLVENGMGAGTLPKINEFRKAHKLVSFNCFLNVYKPPTPTSFPARDLASRTDRLLSHSHTLLLFGAPCSETQRLVSPHPQHRLLVPRQPGPDLDSARGSGRIYGQSTQRRQKNRLHRVRVDRGPGSGRNEQGDRGSGGASRCLCDCERRMECSRQKGTCCSFNNAGTADCSSGAASSQACDVSADHDVR
jgi:hypothetical protein